MTDQEVVVVEVGNWWQAAVSKDASLRSEEPSQQRPLIGGAIAQSRFMGKTAKPIYAESPISGPPEIKKGFSQPHIPLELQKKKTGRTCDESQPRESTEQASQWVWNIDQWRWERQTTNSANGKESVTDILARRWGDGRDSLIITSSSASNAHDTTSNILCNTLKQPPHYKSQGTLSQVKIIRRDPAGQGFASVGGFASQKSILMQSVILPLRFPSLYKNIGVHPGRGILLYGPPGSGKTHLVKALAREANVHLEHINGADCVGNTAAEDRLKRAFAAAKNAAPCILFIDELDAVAPSRSTPGTSDVERQSTALIMSLIDSLRSFQACSNKGPIALIAASNRPHAVDAALRRPGRLDVEYPLGAPNRAEREEMLRCITKNMKLDENVDLCEIAERLQGYMAADIAGCVMEAGVQCVSHAVHAMEYHGNDLTAVLDDSELLAMSRDGDVLDSLLRISSMHFDAAIASMHPALLRNLTADIPRDVTWDDVGGLLGVKQELQELIEWPLLHGSLMHASGLSFPKGALLYGPPGCGKTMIVKAMAASCNVNFISIRGPELLDKWVGESERAIRELFQTARTAAPCIIFFDEIDAIGSRRSGGGSGGNSGTVGDAVSARVLNQLLCEMDGLGSSPASPGRCTTKTASQRQQGAKTENNIMSDCVFVLGATNRPGALDPSLLRPGRLDKIIKVPLPDCAARVSILRKVLRRCPLSPEVDLVDVAAREEMVGMSGADVAEVGKKAGTLFVREMIAQGHSEGADAAHGGMLHSRHVEEALKSTRRSVSEEVSRWYDEIEEKLMNGSLEEEESDPFTNARYKRQQMAVVAEMVKGACEKKAVALQERVRQLEAMLREAGVEVPSSAEMDVDDSTE